MNVSCPLNHSIVSCILGLTVCWCETKTYECAYTLSFFLFSSHAASVLDSARDMLITEPARSVVVSRTPFFMGVH